MMGSGRRKRTHLRSRRPGGADPPHTRPRHPNDAAVKWAPVTAGSFSCRHVLLPDHHGGIPIEALDGTKAPQLSQRPQ